MIEINYHLHNLNLLNVKDTQGKFQVILKPSPDDIQDLYLESLKKLGIDSKINDIILHKSRSELNMPDLVLTLIKNILMLGRCYIIQLMRLHKKKQLLYRT